MHRSPNRNDNDQSVMPDSSAPSSISAAAHAYQIAMASQLAAPSPGTLAIVPVDQISTGDTVMNDVAQEMPGSPTSGSLGNANAPSPLPPRITTPSRAANGNEVSSRAASQHPDPTPLMPLAAPPHGAPTRQYLNSKVTVALLEGMKRLAKEQPKDPLRVLGEFLLQRSRELEGT